MAREAAYASTFRRESRVPEPEQPAIPPEQEMERAPEEVLRAKYLDYCSAQLAGILLLLSPDRIYHLAQRGASSEGLDVTTLPYDEVVQVATREISRIIPLPPFRVWADDYRRHPEVYEEHLLGLWEEEPLTEAEPLTGEEPLKEAGSEKEE